MCKRRRWRVSKCFSWPLLACWGATNGPSTGTLHFDLTLVQFMFLAEVLHNEAVLFASVTLRGVARCSASLRLNQQLPGLTSNQRELLFGHHFLLCACVFGVRRRLLVCGGWREGMIHTAGTVVSSPASLTLAAVRSEAAAVDALLGAASCRREDTRCQHPAAALQHRPL